MPDYRAETVEAILAEIHTATRAADEQWQPDSAIPDTAFEWRDWHDRLTAALERERAEVLKVAERVERVQDFSSPWYSMEGYLAGELRRIAEGRSETTQVVRQMQQVARDNAQQRASEA